MPDYSLPSELNQRGEMGTKSMRVLVVDDFKPWRNFALKTLQEKLEWQVVAEVADGLEAVQQARQLQPDLILLDIGLPTINGIEAARRIREVSPSSKILFLSENRSPDIVEQALNTGACGYIVKSDAAKELPGAVEAVILGKEFVSSSLAGRGSINSGHSAKQAWREKVVSPPGPQNDANGRHEFRLYSGDEAFVRDLAHSIEDALENGNTVVVVATESHRANLLQQLNADGVNIDDVSERKLYIPLDVSDSLSTVLDTSTDGDGFANVVPRAIVEALQTAKEKHLHLVVS